MRHAKRILSALIAAALVIALMPAIQFVSFADEYNGIYYYIENGEAKLHYIGSGITDLVIPSSIDGYPVKSVPPYFINSSYDIKTVKIGEGVETIGSQAFQYLYSLVSVTLPSTIKGIDTYAFRGCEKLESINIPDGIEQLGEDIIDGTAYFNDKSNWEDHALYIGKVLYKAENGFCKPIKAGTLYVAPYALYGLDTYTVSELPDTLRYIGYSSFGSTGITVTEIPGSVRRIEDYAFYGCDCMTSVTVHSGTEKIGNDVFRACDGLVYARIEEGVKELGYSVFASCDNLRQVVIPGSVEKIGVGITSDSNGAVIFAGKDTYAAGYARDNFFANTILCQAHSWGTYDCDADGHGRICRNCGLVEEYTAHVYSNCCDDSCNICGYVRQAEHDYHESHVAPSGGRAGYTECVCADCGHKMIKNPVKAGSEERPVLSIEAGTDFMYDGSVLIKFVPQAGHTYLFKSAGRADTCAGLYRSEDMSDEICTNDDSGVKYNFTMIRSFETSDPVWMEVYPYDSGNTDMYTVKIADCTGQDAVIADGSLERYFGNAENYTVPDGVTRIGKYAFESDETLKSVTVPSSVRMIDNYAFYGCVNLSSVTMTEGLRTVGVGPFKGTAVKEIVYPDTVYTLDSSAVTGTMEKAVFPRDLVKMDPDAIEKEFTGDIVLKAPLPIEDFTCFKGGINSITMTGTSDKYDVRNGCVIRRSDKALMLGSANAVIPSDGSVVMIYDRAFMNSAITHVDIPDSVTEICSSAFANTGLSSVVIPGTVKKIGSNAFDTCANLASVTLCEGIDRIESSAFFKSAVSSVKIPASVTYVGEYCFNGKNLVNIEVAEGNGSYYVKDGCLIEKSGGRIVGGTSKAVIPSDGSVTDISSEAFWNAGIVRAVIPECITYVGTYAFDDCDSLTEMTVLCPAEAIVGNLLYSCDIISKLTLGPKVTFIPEYFIHGCAKLTSLRLPETVTAIKEDAFFYSGLLNILVPDSVTEIAEDAFPGSSDFVLYCNEGSYAAKYADEHDITRKPVSEFPEPAANKGDFDNDGAITVADALAALRIGAKLVEETPEAIEIGDIDGDGHVTVADALAILRVAAKLVDHL